MIIIIIKFTIIILLFTFVMEIYMKYLITHQYINLKKKKNFNNILYKIKFSYSSYNHNFINFKVI